MKVSSVVSRATSALMYVVVIVALTLGILWLIPANYVILMPGSANPTCSLVHVQGGGCRASTGGIFDTYVDSVNANHLLYVALALLKPDFTVSPAADVNPNCPSAQYDTELMQMMADSKIFAEAAALNAAGHTIRYQRWGPQVLEVNCGLPAATKLLAGDRIVGVDGHHISGVTSGGRAWPCGSEAGLPGCSLYEQIHAYVAEHRPCSRVKLTILRGGVRRNLSIQTVPGIGSGNSLQVAPNWSCASPPPANTQALIGIDMSVPFRFPVKVNIQTGDVGGPSAGLAFALAIYQQLTHQDLTRGNKVAVTGTISFSQFTIGKKQYTASPVGAIGGAKQKAYAAAAAGAKYFLVPPANYQDAKSAGTNLIIEKVRSLQDAIRILESLPSHHVAAG